ncbi:MAG TPA: RNA methyltransferase [Candidatus Sulfotelmatobacter sp.]|nr:RNA methyltransferase [Candidatus Sulfotelmatobacter sp.]
MTGTKESAHLQPRLRRIEGRHNPLLKQLRQAFSRAQRTEEGDCAIEGLRMLEEAIRSGLRFRAVFFRESARERADRLLPQIGAHVETLLLPDKLFDAAVPSETPQGVAALVRLKEFSLDDVLEKERLQLGPVVALAGLQDPGNLGTIIRSAEAFGSAGIILGEGTVSPLNAKAVRASAGSVFRLPVVAAPAAGGLEEVVARLRAQGVRLIATSSHKGTPLDQAKLTGTLAVFIGSEGSGLPRGLMTQMDESVAIPHAEQVESLNAGVAGSIVLYESARQRG